MRELNMQANNQARHMAKTVLGPVIHFYLAQLDQHIRQMDDGNTSFLFASRAGVRILRLYEQYLDLNRLQRPSSLSMFWISRFLVCKGMYSRRRDLSVQNIGQELAHSSLRDTVQCIYRAETAFGGMPVPESWQDIPFQPLHEFLASQHDAARGVNTYLESQSDMFERYLGQCIGKGGRAVLIDSGWQGTAQSLLSQAFPEFEWHGLYFGRSFLGAPNRNVVANSVGLVFESDRYASEHPETAIVLHRHLIESLFEPNGPSIERLQAGDDGITAPEAPLVLADPHDDLSDPLYVGVCEYLADNASGTGMAEVYRRHRGATAELARLLTEPSTVEAWALMGKARSADFGRCLHVDPLLPRNPTVSASERLRNSLWPQGQIAVEFPAEDAKRAQRSLTTQLAAAPVERPATWGVEGRVAIITRTKDRPVLLIRAAQSVARQIYENYVWVVVNDGGALEPVREILSGCGVDPRRILLCDNQHSLGMEAASNVGIGQSDSEFIVIHDDDDSWAPDFLRETVSFLKSKSGKKYGGVITKSVYVSEEIRGESVIEHGRAPYQDWVQTVHLSEMVNGNYFPPIAFLFRRSVHDRVGGFDENLPVLGDWDFNLRFLLAADIGVLPKPLAYYHHRDVGGASANYSNSVIGGISKHLEYNSVVRNKYIRNAEYGALAAMMSSGYGMHDLRGRIAGVPGSVGAVMVDHISRKSSALAADSDAVRRQLDRMSAAADQRWVALKLIEAGVAAEGSIFAHEKSSESGSVLVDARGLVAEHNMMLEPPDDFGEVEYLQMYSDVRAAVTRGEFYSGFHHYYMFGCNEGRQRPCR